MIRGYSPRRQRREREKGKMEVGARGERVRERGEGGTEEKREKKMRVLVCRKRMREISYRASRQFGVGTLRD